METTIETTCGYRIEKENGEIDYIGGSTFNGWCYKDMEAWERGEGVIYVGEYSLQDLKKRRDATLWTKEMLLSEVRDTLNCEYPKRMAKNEKFVEFLALVVLETCDWQDLSSYLYELTFDDSIEEMFADKELWKN